LIAKIRRQLLERPEKMTGIGPPFVRFARFRQKADGIGFEPEEITEHF